MKDLEIVRGDFTARVSVSYAKLIISSALIPNNLRKHNGIFHSDEQTVRFDIYGFGSKVNFTSTRTDYFITTEVIDLMNEIHKFFEDVKNMPVTTNYGKWSCVWEPGKGIGIVMVHKSQVGKIESLHIENEPKWMIDIEKYHRGNYFDIDDTAAIHTMMKDALVYLGKK